MGDSRIPKAPPPSLGLVLTILRWNAGCRQGELAEALGIPPSELSAYENGKALSRERLDELLVPLGVTPDEVDFAIFFVETLRQEATEPPGSPFALGAGERELFRRTAARCGRLAVTSLLDELARDRLLLRMQQERARAAVLLPPFLRLPRADQLLLLEGSEEHRSWALCEAACEASIQAAGKKPARALALANLAREIAEQVDGGAVWRARVQGFAWGFVGNARRVTSDLAGAEVAFATAWPLWEAGAEADPGVLDPSRLPDLEASLRRARRRFSEALALLDRALDLAPGRDRAASILLNKASVCEQAGDFEAAVAALGRAVPLIDDRRQPRLAWAHRLNLGVALCHLNRHSEALPLAAEAREIAISLRNEADLLRVIWLEGRAAEGLGRRADAIAALRQVRRGFADQRIPYDVALATLELAVLLLEEGSTAEVRGLAAEMLPIFGALRIERETLAALRVFWEAALREEATAELGRRLLRRLERSGGATEPGTGDRSEPAGLEAR